MLKLILLLFLVTVTCNVEGKAVRKRRKPAEGTGSSYSLVSQSNIVTHEQKPTEYGYWYKSSGTGGNDHQYNASHVNVDEYAKNRNANHQSNINYDSNYASDAKLDGYAKKIYPNHHSSTNYDIENYENLNQMFDSEFVSSDMKQDESHEDKLNSKEFDDPLESDQVFLHHKKEKPKYIDTKVKPNEPENFIVVHSKEEKSETLSLGMSQPEINTQPNKRNLPSAESTTETESQHFETEHPSNKLAIDSGDFGPIKSELIHHSDENLELDQSDLPAEKESDKLTFSETDVSSELDQRNLPTEDELILSEGEDTKVEDLKPSVGSRDNFASNLEENQFSNEDNFDSVSNSEDKNLFKMGINQMLEASFDSFVFNPSAQPLEKFQECSTPRNESGFCRYVQHCMLPSVLNSIQHFMENVCIIQGRFIGVCCPDFPVQTLQVKWGDENENFNDRNDTVDTPEDCGIGTNTRVVGGSDADRKAWLWMVALLNDKKKFFCGGSLINNRYVLTAAHCTFGTSKNHIIARLGEYDFNDPREDHDDYRVIEIKRHGQYNSMNLRNDIALLKLEKPVVFNEFVKTICFPEATKDYIGDVATLVGWGHLNGAGGGTSDVLQMASFPVIANEQCSTSHRLPIPSSLICAAAVKNDKGACNGDSGGPLMLLDENDHWKVIGIVSWGRRGCNPKFPTVYTRVTHYMDWIKKHSK